MIVEILFKDYGKGKERIILVDKATNLAFASYGIKDSPYDYLYKKYLKEKKVTQPLITKADDSHLPVHMQEPLEPNRL